MLVYIQIRRAKNTKERGVKTASLFFFDALDFQPITLPAHGGQ